MAAPLNADIQGTILHAARQLLAEASFAEISLSAIAKAAGVSKGTLYYYYKNKDEILFDIADQYLDRLAESLRRWVDDASKDTSYIRLIRYVLRDGVHDKSGGLRLYLIAAALGGEGELRDRLLAKYREFQGMLAAEIAKRCPGRDAGHEAWAVLALMDGLLVQHRLDNPSLDVDRFIEQLVCAMDAL